MDDSARHQLLTARLRLPGHVVRRDFGEETVILNLGSGNYHGLNATAELMLETLGRSDTVSTAIDELVEVTGQPRTVIEPDVLTLCDTLMERGLLQDDGAPAAT
jgi:hypothetical protein